MPKCSASESRTKNRKAKPNTQSSPETVLEDFRLSSTKPNQKIPNLALKCWQKRADVALERMGVTKKELKLSAQITPILDNALGGLQNNDGVGRHRSTVSKVIGFLRFSTDEAARQFLYVYDSLPKVDRERIPIEAICIKAKINPDEILGATLRAARNISAQESALMTIVEHPEVVRSTVQFSRLAGGSKDREMLHQAVGYLPTPKGVSMSVNLLGGNPQLSRDNEGGGSEDDEDSFESAFPSLNRNLESWGDRRRKLLESGK